MELQNDFLWNRLRSDWTTRAYRCVLVPPFFSFHIRIPFPSRLYSL